MDVPSELASRSSWFFYETHLCDLQHVFVMKDFKCSKNASEGHEIKTVFVHWDRWCTNISFDLVLIRNLAILDLMSSSLLVKATKNGHVSTCQSTHSGTCLIFVSVYAHFSAESIFLPKESLVIIVTDEAFKIVSFKPKWTHCERNNSIDSVAEYCYFFLYLVAHFCFFLVNDSTC